MPTNGLFGAIKWIRKSVLWSVRWVFKWFTREPYVLSYEMMITIDLMKGNRRNGSTQHIQAVPRLLDLSGTREVEIEHWEILFEFSEYSSQQNNQIVSTQNHSLILNDNLVVKVLEFTPIITK